MRSGSIMGAGLAVAALAAAGMADATPVPAAPTWEGQGRPKYRNRPRLKPKRKFKGSKAAKRQSRGAK